MRRHFISLILFTLFITPTQAWSVEIPKGLTRADLDDVTELLGFSTSTKFLSNPFPLGGYSGFEVGFATEFINTTDLSRLGSGTSKQDSFQYNRISVGKGLFYNLDVFMQFVPFSSSNEVSEYGGSLKWNFYQAQFLPFSASVIGHASTINIQDSFINETLGLDLLGGINLNNFALYFGGGNLKARSTFTKSVLDPAMGVTDDLVVRGSEVHTFVGMNIDIASLFIAAQIDRYQEPVYSFKVGLRY